MKSCVSGAGFGCICEHLSSTKVRALYLSDALDTGDAAQLISALIDIRRAIGGQKIVELDPSDMRLSDALDIINRASLRLIAESREP